MLNVLTFNMCAISHRKENTMTERVIIVAIICVTLIILSALGKNNKGE